MNSENTSRRQLLMGCAALGLGSMALSGCASSTATAIANATGDTPIATVAQGKLAGRRQGPVLSFQRIPYAANPYVEANRFKAPQPVPAWGGRSRCVRVQAPCLPSLLAEPMEACRALLTI